MILQRSCLEMCLHKMDVSLHIKTQQCQISGVLKINALCFVPKLRSLNCAMPLVKTDDAISTSVSRFTGSLTATYAQEENRT